jgi:hypothetical protein
LVTDASQLAESSEPLSVEEEPACQESSSTARSLRAIQRLVHQVTEGGGQHEQKASESEKEDAQGLAARVCTRKISGQRV